MCQFLQVEGFEHEEKRNNKPDFIIVYGPTTLKIYIL